MDTKKLVIDYISQDRTLLGGRNLYNKIPGISRAMQNSFARMTNTPEAIEKVCYELAKLAEIPARNLTILMQNPVAKVVECAKNLPEQKELSPEDKLILLDESTEKPVLVANVFDLKDYSNIAELMPLPIPTFEKGIPGTNQRKTFLKVLGIEKPKGKNADLDAHILEIHKKLKDQAIEKAIDNLFSSRKELVAKQLQELPAEIKASLKLRDQFPFLREEDCPAALKLLVNDLITAYENFKTNQPKLHELLGEAEEKAIVDTVKDNYIANKMAYAELEHYGKTNTILGKHPLFERLALKEEIAALATPKLTKKINTLKANITRNKQKDNKDLLERDEDLLIYAESILSKR